MAYRVEIAKSARSGCSIKHCKDEGIKIAKGELRLGVLMTYPDGNSSFKWKHWGCVTPAVIHNWAESAGAQEGDMDLVDGYDELPDELQEKVKRALMQGHVDDEDWGGDPGWNRYDPLHPKRGMYAKRKVKKAEETDGEEEQAPETPKKDAKKKRAHEATENEDVIQKPAKKSRKSEAVKSEPQDDENDHVPKPAKPNTKAARVSKVKAELTEDGDSPAPAKKSKKVKKEPEDQDPPAPAKKGRKAKKEAVEERPPSPAREGKKVKEEVEDDDAFEPAPRKASKKSKADAAVAPVGNGKGATKKRRTKEASPVEESDAPKIEENSPTSAPAPASTSTRRSGRVRKTRQ